MAETEADKIVRELREKREIIKRIKEKLIKIAEKKAQEFVQDYIDNIDKIPLDKFKEYEEQVDDTSGLSFQLDDGPEEDDY